MKPIQPNGLIGLVSPASTTPAEVIQAAIGEIERRGFRVRVFGADLPPAGRFAATDEERRDCLHAAFADPEVDVILCTRGGYGSSRIADLIDYDVLRSNPKPFIGYSDISGLMIKMTKEAVGSCFHGPMAVDFAKPEKSHSIDDLLKAISGEVDRITFDSIEVIRTGYAEGTIWGGNITVIESLIGTSSFYVPENAIIFLEDTNEFMYKFDRSIQHLKRAGLFEQARAVIFADMDIRDEGIDNSLGFSSRDVIKDCLSNIDVPIAINAPFGHTMSQATLPLAVDAKLNLSMDRLDINFSSLWGCNIAPTQQMLSGSHFRSVS